MTQRTPLKRLARQIQRQRGVPYMVARREAMEIRAERAADEQIELKEGTNE